MSRTFMHFGSRKDGFTVVGEEGAGEYTILLLGETVLTIKTLHGTCVVEQVDPEKILVGVKGYFK